MNKGVSFEIYNDNMHVDVINVKNIMLMQLGG